MVVDRAGPTLRQRYCRHMVSSSPDWRALRERLSVILHNGAPLLDRYRTLLSELEQMPQHCYAIYAVRLELESMARSAKEGRELPFLNVGKDLLVYCDSRLYQDLRLRGEDPRWVAELSRSEQQDAEYE